MYTGTVEIAEFDRIVTHADGAVGAQIAQPIGSLTVRRGIETFGGTGQLLVKGVLETLSAIALSIKPGGSARSIIIEGGLKDEWERRRSLRATWVHRQPEHQWRILAAGGI